MGDSVTPLSDFGVATDGPARSVILVSKVPVEELAGRAVAVTAQTSTSIQLLRILFEELWNVDEVSLEGPDAGCGGQLIIGDDALRQIYDGAEARHVYDLSLEWKRLTGLPFVFARWVARSEIGQESIAALEYELTASYEEGMRKIDEIATSWPIDGMPSNHIVDYIRGFTYRLGPREVEAIDKFASLLAKLPEWIPPVYPLNASTSPIGIEQK